LKRRCMHIAETLHATSLQDSHFILKYIFIVLKEILCNINDENLLINGPKYFNTSFKGKSL